MRSIKNIIKSQKVNMGGIILDQPLPNDSIDQLDPFLLIHHWNDRLKEIKNKMKQELALIRTRVFTGYFNL